MALITKNGTPSLSSPTPSRENTITGLHAGEAIAAGDICGIAEDGRIMKADGTEIVPRGIAAGRAAAGDPLTLYIGVNFHYGANLTPGADLFLGTDPGSLDDAGGEGAVPIGFVVDTTRIRFHGRG